jgi:DNA repair photolyase
VRPLPVLNPPNPWASSVVEYLEEPPTIGLEVYEDQSRSILSKNDSPDLPFTYSANPYRGCLHSCAYCVREDTRVSLADGSTAAIHDLRVGERIFGTRNGQVVVTRVLAQWKTHKPGRRIALDDGTVLVTSAAHRLLASTGWMFAASIAPGTLLKTATALRRVESVATLADTVPMVDITTGTGDFIANGVVSHNCYARPTHEYLGFGAGTDFERKIVVKKDAPELLRKALRSPRWKREPILFSGVTDCYQPLEASMELTRRCLEVCLEENTPAVVITKSALVERDAELLVRLAKGPGARVTLSIPFIDEEQARAIEPYAPSPSRRLRAISTLAKAGVPVGVNVAPIIPGLSDEQMPRILEAARAAGARWAGWVMLRLPGHVKEVFEERLREKLPLRAEKVLARLRETHGGKLYDATFGRPRMKGTGPYAEAMAVLFERTCNKLGFEDPSLLAEAPAEQLGLFE